jgi:hypothetical protein
LNSIFNDCIHAQAGQSRIHIFSNPVLNSFQPEPGEMMKFEKPGFDA